MTSPASTTESQPLTGATPTIHGRFLWHELLARDVHAALSFYPPVMTWTVQTMDIPGGAGTYTMFARGEAALAGVMAFPADQLAAGAKSTWLPYIGTKDTAATCRLAIGLGGRQLMPPTEIPTVGIIAVLLDPQGAQFAVLQPTPTGRPETVPVAGEFAWHELVSDDPDASFAFYRQLFGWVSKHRMDMGKDGTYEMYGLGDFMYGGMMRRAPGQPPTTWNCYVRVADLNASVAALKANGGTVIMGPHEVPNNDRVVVAVDNQGAVISLVGAIVRKHHAG